MNIDTPIFPKSSYKKGSENKFIWKRRNERKKIDGAIWAKIIANMPTILIRSMKSNLFINYPSFGFLQEYVDMNDVAYKETLAMNIPSLPKTLRAIHVRFQMEDVFLCTI